MAKREPVLKWEHEIADCHAGPFIVTQPHGKVDTAETLFGSVLV